MGGTVTYSISGSPIAAGTYLLVQRTIPLTQETTVRNQGNYFAQVTEQALDTLCMEIQQVAARTGQMRGTWATGVVYNFGDVVVDGVNGNSTGNYYMAAVANTSGTWATDLAAGDWSLVINIQGINAVIGAYLPLIGGTITGSLSITSNLTVGGTLTPTGGVAANSVAGTALISGGVTNTKLAQMGARTVKGNSGSGTANAADITLGGGLSLLTGAFNTASPNFWQSTPSNPSATTNRTGVMMGLTGAITPTNSRTIMMMVAGDTLQSIASGAANAQIRYGTGVAPTNGSALTGTTAGGLVRCAPANGFGTPICLTALASNLTLNTPYWVDVSLAAVTTGAATIENLSVSLYEIK